MMNTFDVLLVDLQDVGCRIYTFITTLCYVLEEATVPMIVNRPQCRRVQRVEGGGPPADQDAVRRVGAAQYPGDPRRPRLRQDGARSGRPPGVPPDMDRRTRQRRYATPEEIAPAVVFS